MNKLQIFNYNNNAVRTIEKDGEPWFILKDVCNVLGISKYRDTAERLDADERASVRVDTLGGKQEMTCINESGLYNVILRSDKPEAKPFRKWITAEVLPAIRKTGAYMTPQTIEQILTNPDTIISLATQIKELQAKVEQDKPKVLFANAVETSHTSILIGDLAKLIRQNGVEMGRDRLFKWLRDNKYLLRDNMPSQRSMEMGLFEVKERTVCTPDGTKATFTPKVTGKGQTYFVNKILGE